MIDNYSLSSESSSSSEEVPLVFSVLMWILTSLFYALFCVLFVRVIQIVCREKQCRLSIKLAVHCLLLIPILARALDMTIFHEGYLTTPFKDQTTEEMIIGCIPGYTFFSTYSLLFCFWIVLNRQASENRKDKAKDKRHLVIMYSLVNIAVYLIWITLIITISLLHGKKRTAFHMGEVFYAASLNIISAIVFSISGYCVFTRARRMADSKQSVPSSRTSVNNISLPRSNKGMEIANKIWRLTLIFTTVLAVRSVIILADWFVPVSKSVNGLIVTFFLRILFQAVCELVPAILTVSVLAHAIDADPSKQPLLKN